VKLGYKVIEQYINQGQKVAEQISQSAQRGMTEPGTADVVQGIVRLYKDMADVWGNALDLMVRNPMFWSWMQTVVQSGSIPPSAGNPGGTLNGTGTAISVEIQSARPAEVTVNVPPSERPYTPMVHALHAADPLTAPLTAIEFRPSSISRVPIVVVKIPLKQQPGLYTGVVVDKDTNEPKGTLTVRVLPSEP
jgi:hypothetical protein